MVVRISLEKLLFFVIGIVGLLCGNLYAQMWHWENQDFQTNQSVTVDGRDVTTNPTGNVRMSDDLAAQPPVITSPVDVCPSKLPVTMDIGRRCQFPDEEWISVYAGDGLFVVDKQDTVATYQYQTSGGFADTYSDEFGETNTNYLIIAGNSPIADFCRTTYSDGWNVPAKNELNVLYANKDAIRGFSDDWYWSSTEEVGGGYVNAHRQNFDNGTQNVAAKTQEYLLRCIRSLNPPDRRVKSMITDGNGTVDGHVNPIPDKMIEFDFIGERKSAEFTVVPAYGWETLPTGGTCDLGGSTGTKYKTGVIHEDCEVEFGFEEITYTITATAEPNGSVTPGEIIVSPVVDPHAVFTVSPNVGYDITNVEGTCPTGAWAHGDMTVLNEYTISHVVSDCDVHFTFALRHYSVTAAVIGNGSIIPTGYPLPPGPGIGHGHQAIFDFTPGTGQELQNVTATTCGPGNITGNRYSSNPVTQACRVDFYFIPQKRTVTASSNAGGTFSPSQREVDYNSTASFTVTPNASHNRSSAVGGTCPGGSWSGNVYTTGQITNNCTVAFSFTIKQYTVTPSHSPVGRGTLSPSVAQTVGHGSRVEFTVTPNTGYQRGPVGGGCSTGTWSGNTYRINNVTASCSVSFTYAAGQYTVSLNRNGGSGGTGSVTATYNAAMPAITVPTRTGYAFDGYFDATSGGTRYYNANGSSARTWNKTANTTLYARWVGCTISGGSVSNSGSYRVHRFTGSGTFSTNCPLTVDLLLVGGGGGAAGIGGGGGGGQVSYYSGLSVAAGSHNISVGAGGNSLSHGGSSSAFGRSASGGRSGLSTIGGNSGSGQPGSGGCHQATGGGGGDGQPGGGCAYYCGGAGGNGTSNSITGSSITYGGGGGGGNRMPRIGQCQYYDNWYCASNAGLGGSGGGGNGSSYDCGQGSTSGVNGLGGGGGGDSMRGNSSKGGSGVVIVRYLR